MGSFLHPRGWNIYEQERGSDMTARRPQRSDPRAGYTLIELLIVMVLLTIVLGTGYQALRSFGESSIVDRAATAISGDVRLTRAYAIQRRSDVSLVVDPASRSYAIRDGADTLATRRFSAASELPLTVLSVTPTGPVTFNGRGLLQGTSSVAFDLARHDTSTRLFVSALGRTRVTQP